MNRFGDESLCYHHRVSALVRQKRLLVALLPVVTVLGALAPSDLAGARVHPVRPTLILTHTLANYVAAPPGIENGPLTVENLSLLDHMYSAGLARRLSSGTLAGYVRKWVHAPRNGDVIIIATFSIPARRDRSAFLLSAETAYTYVAKTQSGSLNVISNVQGAFGANFLIGPATSPQYLNVALFEAKRKIFLIETVSALNDLSYVIVNGLAGRQAALANNSGATSGLILPFTNSPKFRRDGQIAGEF